MTTEILCKPDARSDKFTNFFAYFPLSWAAAVFTERVRLLSSQPLTFSCRMAYNTQEIQSTAISQQKE